MILLNLLQHNSLQIKTVKSIASPVPITNLSNKVRISSCFPQGDPGGIIGPPGLPGPKGEAGPPGKSLPGEPVSTSPFSNVSFGSSLMTTCGLPVSEHKYNFKCTKEETSLDHSCNPFKGSMQEKPLF